MKGLYSTLFFSFICLSSSLTAQYAEVGYAVYYADYLAGEKTAYGELYNPAFFTCAHKQHPLGTLLKVSRIDDGRSIVVRVNDKGPFKSGYIVDLSKVAGSYIGLDLDGKAQVRVEVVGYSKTNPVPEGYVAPQSFSARGAGPSNYADVPTSYGAGDLSNSNSGAIRRLEKGQGGFGIQLASYSLEENAERQAKSLQEQGVKNLYLQESWTNYQGKMYRLIVGRFSDRNKAVQHLDYLRRQKGVNGFVTMLE